ncbi:hypothetical protein PF004_g24571 [Phytophthora fragariae]|uniref:Uncharacterized protein n=1 Tax=Phytophthora fragariae TaxID=53985 RepID=A0A6A3I104_9STRA|nr:hypothetical protein PF011_g24470 [Phytophthora fragariae]KAE9181340.1 hypothetical protein PF004_g24571 [Phytophthora fragariae]
MVKRLWNGCIEYDREPRQFHTETLLEPTFLQYSFEVLEWAPRTSNWVAEVTELDALSLFVPRGLTSEEVAASVVVEPTLPASSVSAPWVTQFGAGRDDNASEEESKDSPNLGADTP